MKISKKVLTLLSISTVLSVQIHGSNAKELDFRQENADGTIDSQEYAMEMNIDRNKDYSVESNFEHFSVDEDEEAEEGYFELMDEDLEDENEEDHYYGDYYYDNEEVADDDQYKDYISAEKARSANYKKSFESSRISGEEFTMQLEDDLDALTNDYPVDCEEFYTFGGRKLKAVAKFFKTNVKGLRILNPGINLRSLKAGTVICVVGTLKKSLTLQNGNTISNLGKRPKNSMEKYTTKPGVDTCESLQEYSQPPLSLFQLVKMNPKLSCIDMLTSPQEIYLPKGTIISDMINSASSMDRDCLFSSWSEWSACDNGKKTRMRNIYEEARGNGIACPEAYEAQKCHSSNGDSIGGNNIEEDEDTYATNDLNVLSQCSNAGQDGCSNPGYDYRVFATACNYHDICWACDKRDKWGISKQTCDRHFHILMRNTCHLYWRDWFQKTWCFTLADIFYTGVKFANDGYDARDCPSWSLATNAKLGGYIIGHKVPYNCPCSKKSCSYRGTPFPCWGRDTICGAGTTCNNCCNGYSWKWKFFFTACN